MISHLSCILMHAKFSEYSLKHKKEHTSDIKRDKLMEFFSTNRLQDAWETLSSFSKYFMSNSLSQQ